MADVTMYSPTECQQDSPYRMLSGPMPSWTREQLAVDPISTSAQDHLLLK